MLVFLDVPRMIRCTPPGSLPAPLAGDRPACCRRRGDTARRPPGEPTVGPLPGPGKGRLECLAPKTRALVMHGGVDLRAPSSRAPNSPARAWNRRRSAAGSCVERITQAAGGGSRTDPRTPGVQDELVDELLERRLDRIGRDVHDPGEDVRHEAAADDGAGARGRLRLGRELRDPRNDRVLDRVGDVRLADGPAVRTRLRAERTEQFLDVKGMPSVRS